MHSLSRRYVADWYQKNTAAPFRGECPNDCVLEAGVNSGDLYLYCMGCGCEKIITAADFKPMWQLFSNKVVPKIIARRLIWSGAMVVLFILADIAVAVAMLQGMTSWLMPILFGLAAGGMLWSFLHTLIINQLLVKLRAEITLRKTSR